MLYKVETTTILPSFTDTNSKAPRAIWSVAFTVDFKHAQAHLVQCWIANKRPNVIVPLIKIDIARPLSNEFISNISIAVLAVGQVTPVQVSSDTNNDYMSLFQENLLRTLLPKSTIIFGRPSILFLQQTTVAHANYTLATSMGGYFQYRNSLYFMSCTEHSRVQTMSFGGYISALENSSWMLLICYVSVLFYSFSFLRANFNFATVAFPVILLLGQGVNQIAIPKVTLCAWLVAIASIFLAEQFRGSNIDKFTSHLSKQPFEDLNELVVNNFTFYSLPENILKPVIEFRLRTLPKNMLADYNQRVRNLLKFDMFYAKFLQPNLQKQKHFPKHMEAVKTQMHRPINASDCLAYNSCTCKL